jgi:hypothetical protein
MSSELLDDLHRAGGPDRTPAPEAFRLGLVRLQAEVDRPRRSRIAVRRLGLVALAVCAAALAAIALTPGRTPGAAEILERAAAAVTPGAGTILFAETESRIRLTDGTIDRFGTRRVWVREVAGEPVPSVRMLYVSGPDAGAEEVTRAASGRSSVTERYSPATGRVTVDRGAQMVPGEIFHAATLLERARAGADVERRETTVAGRPAYELRWEEPSPAGHRVAMALWVDAETYAPLRFTDRGQGRNAGGPYDQTFVETVTEFERLPDTPENRRLLQMQSG